MVSIIQKLIILVILVTVFIGAVIIFIISPTINDIKKISQDVYDERLGLEIKYQKGQLLKETIKDFEKFRPDQIKLSNSFIHQGQELKFITTLEKIASQNNISQDIQLNFPAADAKMFQAVPLTLTIQGNFSQILSYLDDLERLDLYLIFSSIKMTASGNQSQTNNLITAILTGQTYSLSAQIEK